MDIFFLTSGEGAELLGHSLLDATPLHRLNVDLQIYKDFKILFFAKFSSDLSFKEGLAFNPCTNHQELITT